MQCLVNRCFIVNCKILLFLHALIFITPLHVSKWINNPMSVVFPVALAAACDQPPMSPPKPFMKLSDSDTYILNSYLELSPLVLKY